MTTPLGLFTRYGKHFGAFMIITLGTTQCASTPDGRKTQGQGAALGAVGGALLGAGIGALAGNSDAVRKGALIGAGVGATGGFLYGSHVAKKKAEYASTEDWLDACIVQAEAKRKEAVAYNQSLNRELAQLEKQVRMAKAAGNKSELASLKRTIGSKRSYAQKQANAFNKEAEMQRGAINEAGGQGSSRLKSLRTSTSGIETQVSTMNRNVERYAALESQTDV